MNPIFKLIVLTLLISNTFFTFFISYDIYNKNFVENQEEKEKLNQVSLDYKRKINTLYYTTFIDSYNFIYAEINDITSNNILQTNPEILYNISYNCTILDNESSETCNNLLKETNEKKKNFIKSINDIKSSYNTALGTIAFKTTTFDDFSKEIETKVESIMEQKSFQSIRNEYIQTLDNLKTFLDTEYTKFLENR